MSSSNQPSRWRSYLELSSTVLLVITSVTILSLVVWDRYHRAAAPPRAIGGSPILPVPTEPVSLAGAALRGDPKAPVVLIGFSEFECPYCGRHARDVQPAIDRQYVETGQVLLAFRHLPLPNHSRAQKAAEAAECAGQQGRFWEMHNGLFARQDALDVATLRQHARDLRLGIERFDACLEGEMADKVLADLKDARAFSITSTPTFLVGRRETDGRVKVAERLRGARPLADFQRALDTLLADQGLRR